MNITLQTISFYILGISAFITVIFVAITMVRLYTLAKAIAVTDKTVTVLQTNRAALHEKNMVFQEAIKKPIRKAATIFKTVSVAMAIRTAIHMMQRVAEKTLTRHHED